MSDFCKHYKQKKIVSYDSGTTWQDVVPAEYQMGALYESCSSDCGYAIIKRWVTDGTVCMGKDLYALEKQQISYDGGTTFNNTPIVRAGGLIGTNVEGCGAKLTVTYIGGTEYAADCDLELSVDKKNITDGGYSSAVTSAIIGECVNTINEYAFSGCSNLTSIVIPDNVTEINKGACISCHSLSSVTMSDNIEEISDYCFYEDSGLTSINLPSGLTSIGDWAFWRCSGLTNVVMPDSVEYLGEDAFYDCSSLTSVTLSSGITYIRKDAFSYCRTLSGITIPQSVERIGYGAFWGSGLRTINIPSSVTRIDESAFRNCNHLLSVTVNAVTPPTLGSYAFDNTGDCPIYVPCEAIDDYKAASGWSTYASRITTLSCPVSVKLFFYDEAPATIYCNELQGSVSYSDIGNDLDAPITGDSGNSITQAVIGTCVTELYATFYYCPRLSAVTFSNGSTLTGLTEYQRSGFGTYGVFQGCERITSIELPDSLTKIGKSSFQTCTSLSSVTIPNSVTSIGASAFTNCFALTSINIPSGITSIGTSVFQGCRSFTNFVIPNNITSIGSYAFQGCYGLTSVTIPSSVTSIGSYAFQACTALTSITVNATTPPSLFGASDVFENTHNAPIYVPCSSVNVYKSASGWSDYASRIQAIPDTCTMKYKATYSSGSYSAACDSYDDIVNGEVTLTNLLSVEIGTCVTTIGYRAFFSGTSLTSVTLGNSVTTIGENAFDNCYNLRGIDIPSNVTTISQYAFNSCYSLSSVTIGTGLTSIGRDAFAYCSGLTTCTIDEGSQLESISGGAFYFCTGLTAINIPNSVTYIGNSAFAGCYSLTNVTIPSGVTSISQGAFYYCSGLTSIDIPSGVTTIDTSAFYGCTGLTSITVNAVTPPTLGNYVFVNTNDAPIYVPCESLDDYKSASGWTEYESRIEAIPNSCVAKLRATYTGGTTYSAECDSTSYLTTGDTRPSGYDFSAMTDAIIGYCISDISEFAFSGCTSLSSVTMHSSVTGITGLYAFRGCTSLSSITIPNSVVQIWQGAFYDCTSLTSCTIGSGVTLMGGYDFYNCVSLTSVGPVGSGSSVEIPSGITSMGNGMFSSCTGLTSVTIPNSVTSIGRNAFRDCSGLTSITCLATTPPTLANTNAFNNTNNCPIYVPSASVNTYKSDSGWRTYADRIQPIP